MLEAGTVLQGRYKINKQIGQGGMGAVYIATDERFGSTVAIKETFFSDPSYSKAFEREARLLNNLRHSALPRVSDHFSDPNGQFLVMEYIAGEDLSEKLENEVKVFATKDVLNWADQLLDALDFLHSQETPVIHRDIKPQNLKLTPRGQIILLDFGLAKGNPTDALHQTAAKSVFGYSRNYASIEQIQGTGTDPRSDLYSLGATLYHLMTGVPPVDALTRAMQVLNGDKDPLKLANQINPQIPASVAEVLQQAMDLNSNQRPVSAAAMRKMLSNSDEILADVLAIGKPNTEILTQETEIKIDNIVPFETQQSAAKTEVLPNKTEASISNFPETETNLKPFAEKQNINIPIQPQTATTLKPLAAKTNSNGSKRGLAIGATALGGVLLAGSALGGLFVFKPDLFQRTASNSNTNTVKTIVAENPKTNVEVSNSNVNISNVNVGKSSNGSNLEIATDGKETPQKPIVKPTTDSTKPPAEKKDVAKETVKPAENPGKKEAKVVVQDEDGTKIYDSGKIVTNDGTVIDPSGKITKNGKVIVVPNPNIQVAPTPPDAKAPQLTPEQFRNLTPAQRKRLRRIMENQRRTNNLPPPANP